LNGLTNLEKWALKHQNILRCFGQISVINSEHRSVFCALCAHLEEASISVLLLMSRECVQLKYHDVLDLEKSTWTTQSSKNIGKVLDHLKLRLDDETTLNIIHLGVIINES
jgi:hypothetical protein